MPQDLEAFSAAPPAVPLNLLFIHHSVGGQWLADPGTAESTQDARRSLHKTHPNGGGLRRRLVSQGYSVHEASYGSAIGDRTDFFDWRPKFRDSMPKILSTRHQDELLSNGRNQIVMFKSCYPNNAFKPESAREDSRGPTLTVARAKQELDALRELFAERPETLFIYVTAPPLRDDSGSEATWKRLAKRMLGRQSLADEREASARAAREFNQWAAAPHGWLAGFARVNIAVFDYFDLLTGGTSNYLEFPSQGGTDNHPATEAQQLAAARFVPFLNRAVRRAGLA